MGPRRLPAAARVIWDTAPKIRDRSNTAAASASPLTRRQSPQVASLAGVDISALAAAYSCFPLKFAVAFPLTYHYIGAVRHTLWDRKPESMLNNKDAEMSSYILVGSSTAVSTALALMPF